jgi:hypothetical protein
MSPDKMSNPLYLALHYLAHVNSVSDPKAQAETRKGAAVKFLTLLVVAPRDYQHDYSSAALSAGLTLEAAGWYRSASAAQLKMMGRNAWETQAKLGEENLSKMSPDQLVASAARKGNAYSAQGVVEERSRREQAVFGNRHSQGEALTETLNQLGAAADQFNATSNPQLARQQAKPQPTAGAPAHTIGAGSTNAPSPKTSAASAVKTCKYGIGCLPCRPGPQAARGVVVAGIAWSCDVNDRGHCDCPR